MYRVIFKSLLDRIGAVLALLLLGPLMAVIAMAIRVSLGRPILFKQQRPGLGGEPFDLLKFRTMTEETDLQGRLRPDRDRLTQVGRFFRSSSLDELPELLNILLGKMSFVGPRPLLMQYLPLYSKEQARRHEVRPGLTGWAQVNGRNSLSWEEKFRLDVWYVDHVGFLLDSRILLTTFWKVLRREGIAQEGEATMDYFRGENR